MKRDLSRLSSRLLAVAFGLLIALAQGGARPVRAVGESVTNVQITLIGDETGCQIYLIEWDMTAGSASQVDVTAVSSFGSTTISLSAVVAALVGNASSTLPLTPPGDTVTFTIEMLDITSTPVVTFTTSAT